MLLPFFPLKALGIHYAENQTELKKEEKGKSEIMNAHEKEPLMLICSASALKKHTRKAIIQKKFSLKNTCLSGEMAC